MLEPYYNAIHRAHEKIEKFKFIFLVGYIVLLIFEYQHSVSLAVSLLIGWPLFWASMIAWKTDVEKFGGQNAIARFLILFVVIHIALLFFYLFG